MPNILTVTINNDPYLGGIKITTVADPEQIEDISTISRLTIDKAKSEEGRDSGGNIIEDAWHQIYEKEILAVEDLNNELLDIYTVNNTSYDYTVRLWDDTGENPVTIETYPIDDNEFWFDGLLVGNTNKAYLAGTNWEVSKQLNTQAEYVSTMSGKYPFRVTNADTCYYSGGASGLFLKVTDDKHSFIPDYDHKYSKEVVEFLADHTEKILKTSEGEAWFVTIANVVTASSNERYTGMNGVEFNWTEIGEVPNNGLVVLS